MAGAVELLWWKKRQREFSREKAEEYFGPVREEERVFLPFQRVELLGVDKKGDLRPLFPQDKWPRNYPREWKNLLIWGDNLVAMEALRRGVEINGERISLAGKIRLIYIDPPFATGADFSFKVPVPEEWREVCGGGEMLKEPSLYEELAYRDMWAGRTAEERISSYLSYMRERLLLMKELLADDGSIYVHLDYRMVHFVKLMMDEIFGRENFRNEIIWHYRRWSNVANVYQRMHDVLLFYSKTDNYVYNIQYQPYAHPEYIEDTVRGIVDGRLVRLRDEKGQYIRRERENIGVPMHDVWEDINFVQPTASERLNYPTQKPERLLERIVLASSNEGDIVADFFCGSGTLAAVAEKLGRRWVCCDMSRYAVHVARKRLLDIEHSKALGLKVEDESKRPSYGKPVRPFYVLTVGNYLLGELSRPERREEMINLVLSLYGGERLEERTFKTLHGKLVRENRKEIIHVSEVDFPVTLPKIDLVVEEFKNSPFYGDYELVILGWDFGPNTFESAENLYRGKGVPLKLLQIPPRTSIDEVLKSEGKSLEDFKDSPPALPEKVRERVRFHEPGFLRVRVEPGREELEVCLEIEHFWVRFPVKQKEMEDCLQERMKGVSPFHRRRYFLPLIDYWAVDWTFDGAVFKHDFVSFRLRKRKLEPWACHRYEKAGDYRVFVRVVDIFGGETSKEFTIKVPLKGKKVF